MNACRPAASIRRDARGFTLIELMVTSAILAVVILVVTLIMVNSTRVQARTVRRAEVQSASRQTVSLMSTEIRQAGADPGNPPIGVVGIVTASATSIRVRADLNGDRALQTTEPSEDVAYAYDAANKRITRDPGSGAATVLSNVTAMQLSYYDAANAAITPLPLNAADAARVATVGLTVTTEKRDSKPLTLTTRITLRNR